MSVKKDILADQSLKRTIDGYEIERIYIVDNVEGSSESRLYNAMATSGIPQFGDPHPILPDVTVTDITARPISGSTPNTVKVSVTYAVLDKEDTPAIEGEFSSGVPVISSGLTSEDTILDVNGDWIRVQFRGASSLTTKYENISVQRPQMRITLSRTETILPKEIIAQYLGSVNDQAWSGFPPKTWLCSSINVQEEKTGWEVEYSFSYKPDTWRAVVTVGIPATVIEDYPPDVDSGNGYGVFDVYPSKDFNLLGLSF